MIPVLFAQPSSVGLLLSFSPSLYLDFVVSPTSTLGQYADNSLDLNFASQTYGVVGNNPSYGPGQYLVQG
jgi:hypothetical protein